MRRLALLTLLMLAACTQGPDRATALNALVGRPETDVVCQFGVPTRSFETGGRRFLAYDEQRSSTVLGGGPFAFGGFARYDGRGFAGFYSFPAEIIPQRCETTFEIAADRVVTWALRGNACS